MPKLLRLVKNTIYTAAVLSLAAAAFLFMKFNGPIIKNDVLLYTTLTLNLLGLIAVLFIRKKTDDRKKIGINLAGSLAVSGFLIYSVLTSVLIDFFQPLSLYDQVIYLALTGLVILMFFLIIRGIAGVIRKEVSFQAMLSSVLLLVFLLQFYGLGTLQKDFEYTNIEGEARVIFDSGESGYKIFRIPTLLILPEGSVLNNGRTLESDLLIAMAEARRNGSLDHGDIDLVQKRSTDGGKTWSELKIVRTYEPGEGKIGNSTPVFDSVSGKIILLHLAGVQEKSGVDTYKISSNDGGLTWTEPEFIYEGAVGPGHGIMIQNGPYAGRLVVPGYNKGGSLSLYSDDHGKTWQISEKLDDGNEAEITEINENGDLLMVVRTNQGVAQPHGPLEKLYTTSSDGGKTWSELKIMNGIKEPICMSSIVRSGNALYYSHPDDYYSRGQMTIAASYDEGKTFSDRKLIYQGAAGYSDLGVLSDGDLILVFEGGAIEYDEQIRLVRISRF